MGFPTHPITQALFYAETQREVNSAIRKSYGWSDPKSYFLRPEYNYVNGRGVEERRMPLKYLSNEQLLEIMFRVFLPKYKSRLMADYVKNHFKLNIGSDLYISEHKLENWSDGRFTGKNALCTYT